MIHKHWKVANSKQLKRGFNVDDRATELKKTAGDDLKDCDKYALKIYLDERYP